MVTIIRRTASDKIIQLSHSFPAVAIIGPRQSGKTTLVRNIFPDNNLYYWQDKTGHEIDCIIDRLGTELIPVEIKAGRTIAGDFFKNNQYFNKLSGQTPERSFIVYGGDKHQKRAAGQVVSYMDLKSIYELL